VSLPTEVTVVEVGPRDGLQNEPKAVPAAIKIALIDRLTAAGLPVIEATAFVSPRWVPQMADCREVLAGITPRPGVRYPVLVPNLQGFAAAIEAGAREVAVFPAASEAFSRRNLNCSIAESLERIRPVADAAQAQGIRLRGYISCVLGCPYQGEVPAASVAAVARALLEMGCAEISLGDTIGVGTPAGVRRLLEAVTQEVAPAQLAGHFHDTYGMAIANICAALDAGVTVFDSSVSGLGGCPYARGATGNVATEDLVYLLHGLGLRTGIDLDRLIDAGEYISAALGRTSASRVGRALLARRIRPTS
jgi:isopropylmalate/homocitrate/citramalate synthase